MASPIRLADLLAGLSLVSSGLDGRAVRRSRRGRGCRGGRAGPTLFAATFSVVPPAERGAAAGTATLFIDLGFGGGPLLAGFVAAGAGIPAAFAAAGLVAAIGTIGTLVGPRLLRPATAVA